MPTETTYTALDRKAGLTLDELAKVVQRAMRDGIPGDAHVRVEVGFRSQLQKVTVRHEE